MSKPEKNGIENPAFIPDQFQVPDDVKVEQDDPWALPEMKVDFTPWSELTATEKIKRVLGHYVLKILILLGALYVFICSLSFLGDAFKLLGGKAAGRTFRDNEILANPVAGLMIGLLATVLLQSSSTTTSIIVSMVGSNLISVRRAIPIVMGANIGTSVTNTIVSMGQITNKDEFRRAFAGATVHDMFNWLTVCVLLPIEVIFGFLEWLTGRLVAGMKPETNEDADRNFLTVITNPFTKLIIQIDKNVIRDIAHNTDGAEDKSIIKHCCVKNANKTCIEKCVFMFEKGASNGSLSDTGVGIILLFIALFLLCTCLILIVKCLHSLLRGQIAHVIRTFVNADFPGKVCGYFTGYLAILIGAVMTVLVQSSSVFTSSLTPLVGIGVLTVERMYPLTLGSNIGTTATGLLAALAQDSESIQLSMQIALCHFLFNVIGICIFYPLPFFRPPINAAKFLGLETSKYRWFAILYLILGFFALPAFVFGLSIASWIALAVIFIPLILIFFIVLIVKLIQKKRPQILPAKFRNWKWLPVPLRSLEPYDRAFLKVTGDCYICRRAGCCKAVTEQLSKSADTEVVTSNGYTHKPVHDDDTTLEISNTYHTKL